MNWLNWLCIDFVIEWLWVQTLLRTKRGPEGECYVEIDKSIKCTRRRPRLD